VRQAGQRGLRCQVTACLRVWKSYRGRTPKGGDTVVRAAPVSNLTLRCIEGFGPGSRANTYLWILASFQIIKGRQIHNPWTSGGETHNFLSIFILYAHLTSDIEHCVCCAAFFCAAESRKAIDRSADFDSVLAPTALLLLPCTINKHKTIIARPCTQFARRSAL